MQILLPLSYLTVCLFGSFCVCSTFTIKPLLPLRNRIALARKKAIWSIASLPSFFPYNVYIAFLWHERKLSVAYPFTSSHFLSIGSKKRDPNIDSIWISCLITRAGSIFIACGTFCMCLPVLSERGLICAYFCKYFERIFNIQLIFASTSGLHCPARTSCSR